MTENQRLYRMTENQRQQYVLLLFSGCEREALAFRDECDDYWTQHPEEWEQVRIPDHQPIPPVMKERRPLMARKKEEPIITQTEILAMAGQHIQKAIMDLRRETEELAVNCVTKELQEKVAFLREGTERQVSYHMERLEAIETLYRIQTGTELGLIAEL